MYDFGFSRRFVLVRVWYLSSSEAYINNWDLFGKENYLTFDWWKHFLKILRRSEVTINLTRRLKKNGRKWVRPLVVLYSWFWFGFYFGGRGVSDSPSSCGWNHMHCKVTCILYKKQAHFSQLFCLQVRSVTLWQSHDRKSRCLKGRRHSSILYSSSEFFSSYFVNEVNF